MRKLILITVLMLASASAFAGQTRSLTLASNEPLVQTSVSQPTVDRASVAKVSVKLAQAAAPIQSDAVPTLPQTTTTQTQAPVQTAAPATTTQPTTTTKPATKPTRKESYAHKARRIAARYGVYW
jgi:cell division septation protein DedD